MSSGGTWSTINSTNLGGTWTDNTILQSINSSKPTSKRKIKHNRWISKNSGRGSRGNSQTKSKSRKDKSLIFDLNNLTRSTHQTISYPNKSQNLASSQISSNKASRYNQLIGSWNPNMLYQTQQCCAYNPNKSSGPTSPKNQNKMQVLSNKYLIKKEVNDPIWAFNLNSNLRQASWKKSEKKSRQNNKYSTWKAKNSSAARSITKKITSPSNKIKVSKERTNNKISSATQTAREIARTSRKEKSNGKKDIKNSWFSSSKFSSWVDAINNGATSEINSNMYRNWENTALQPNRTKSSRSNVSTKKKRKKHYSSIGQALEKQKTVDVSRQNNFTNQLLTLIQNIHSPKNPKSHNHSHSEVQSQAVKRIVQPKNRHSYKVSKKWSSHIRSNTSETTHKPRSILNPLHDVSNALKSITNDTLCISPTNESQHNQNTFVWPASYNKHSSKNK